MTYFKLDIPKINESISRYKEIKKNCLEDLGIVYRGLGYTESAWNDSNAYIFIEKAKKDKYKINEYFSYLDNLYNEINQFKTDIDTICSKQGYRRNSTVFKFDDSDIDNCKRYLDSAVSYLNDSLNKINISAFKPDFEYIGLVHTLRNEIRTIRNSINELKQEINIFVNSINNEIYDSKYRMKRIGDFDFNLKTIDYNWNTTDLNTKMVNKYNQEIYSNVKGGTIENKVTDSRLSNIPNSYNANINEFNMKESNKINGLNNNITSHLTNENEIQLQESKTIQGLNNNLNSNFVKENNIKLEESKIVNGLNENLNSSKISENRISFESNNNIKNLNYNIEDVKPTNNSINYTIDNMVNIADNIVNSEVKQANINTSNIVSNNYDLGSGIDIAETKSVGTTLNINNNINIDTNIKKMETLSELDKK